MDVAGIYKITSPKGKVYIGQSWIINQRKKKYKGKSKDFKKQGKLYNSVQKYGWNSHKHEIIHELPPDCTQEVMDRYEVLYWELYKACGVEMLNIREPGSRGKHSQKTKDKIKKSKKKEAILNKGVNHLFYNKRQSIEHKEKVKSLHIGEKSYMFGKKGLNHPCYGHRIGPKYQKVLNVETGEIYKSVTEAARICEIAYKSLKKYLNNPLDNKTNLILLKQ